MDFVSCHIASVNAVEPLRSEGEMIPAFRTPCSAARRGQVVGLREQLGSGRGITVCPRCKLGDLVSTRYRVLASPFVQALDSRSSSASPLICFVILIGKNAGSDIVIVIQNAAVSLQEVTVVTFRWCHELDSLHTKKRCVFFKNPPLWAALLANACDPGVSLLSLFSSSIFTVLIMNSGRRLLLRL